MKPHRGQKLCLPGGRQALTHAVGMVAQGPRPTHLSPRKRSRSAARYTGMSHYSPLYERYLSVMRLGLCIIG